MAGWAPVPAHERGRHDAYPPQAGRLTTLGIALALLITLAIGWAVNKYALGEAARAADWVAHTLEVQRGLESVETDLRTAQSMARGHDSMRSLQQRIAEVRALTSDNPARQRALDALAGTAAAYARHLDSLFEISRERGIDAARRHFVGGAGHPLPTSPVCQAPEAVRKPPASGSPPQRSSSLPNHVYNTSR